MEKLDLRKQLKHLYHPSAKQVSVVTVPEMEFLKVDGQGDPNTSQDFQDALQALYASAYTLKFMVKLGPMHIDYPVMALEALWWTDDPGSFDMPSNKDRWRWTAMIMQPDFITPALLDEARAKAHQKRDVPALEKIHLECFDEGQAAQIMYIGPYSAEAPTIEKLHQFIDDQGGKLRGRHHEIYLGDPRRSAPESLKTVIRQPFA
jgi:hypothetical protein